MNSIKSLRNSTVLNNTIGKAAFTSLSMFRKIMSFFVLMLVAGCLYSQTPDTGEASVETVDTTAKHLVKRAVILSAVLPGAGQIYNRKFWKAPVIWGTVGTGIWLTTSNAIWYNRFKNAALEREQCANDPNCIGSTDEFSGILPDEYVLFYMERYHKWMEISYIATGVVYILQIVDASVDAHLFTFNVSDDLSMDWQPWVAPVALHPSGGIGIKLIF